jgi:uncharacterized membrane protein
MSDYTRRDRRLLAGMVVIWLLVSLTAILVCVSWAILLTR